MKRAVRASVIFLVLVLAIGAVSPVSAHAAGKVIDVTTASDGYFTVEYTASVKMKVGVKLGGETTYFDYVSGEKAQYAFKNGNGTYEIILYRNTSGTKYKKVTSVSVNVELVNELAPNLVSTYDVSFAEGDAVCEMSAALCEGKNTDDEKVAAIYSFISKNFSYDHELAAKISSKTVSNYIPNPGRTLEAGSGICYDLASLFAAMCRSQGIACAVVKGYHDGVYHAWNTVTVDGTDYLVDPTYGISVKTEQSTVSNCIPPMDGYVA